ncbi:uncharacterized protein F5147DRAFT_695581, partial [Suillus discolor]
MLLGVLIFLPYTSGPSTDVSDAWMPTFGEEIFGDCPRSYVSSEEHSSLTFDTSGHQDFFDGFFSSMFLTGGICLIFSSSVVHSFTRHAPGVVT